jgi:hypothetical protein
MNEVNKHKAKKVLLANEYKLGGFMKKILFCVLLLFIQNQVNACSCIPQASVKVELAKSDVVITGKVFTEEPSFVIDSPTGIHINRIKYSIIVENIYKGKLIKDTLQVISGRGNGDCGFTFEIGEIYVIYANYRKRYYTQGNIVPQYLYTDICKRTRQKDESEIMKLESMRKVRKRR